MLGLFFLGDRGMLFCWCLVFSFCLLFFFLLRRRAWSNDMCSCETKFHCSRKKLELLDRSLLATKTLIFSYSLIFIY